MSPLVNALENNENISPSNTDTSDASTPSHPEEIIENSGSEIERSGNTSGFDEKTSTSGSSGIETSEHSHDVGHRMPQQIEEYYTTSDEESYDTDDEEEEEDEIDDEDDCDEYDDDASEHYFDTEEEETEAEEEEEEVKENTRNAANNITSELLENTLNHNTTGSSDSSNTLTNAATQDSLNMAYQSAYSRWVDLYWNQMTFVQDYVKFFNFTRQQEK